MVWTGNCTFSLYKMLTSYVIRLCCDSEDLPRVHCEKDRGTWRRLRCDAETPGGNDIQRIFLENVATLKCECEMVSLPKSWIIAAAPLMSKRKPDDLENSCNCIHKHFFRTHNPWVLIVLLIKLTDFAFQTRGRMSERHVRKEEFPHEVNRLREEHKKVKRRKKPKENQSVGFKFCTSTRTQETTWPISCKHNLLPGSALRVLLK